MAADSITPNSTRWNNAVTDYDAAEAALAVVKSRVPSRVRDEIVAIARDAEHKLFRAPSPTLGGLRRKLEVFWDIRGEAHGRSFERIIIGDLTRIEMLLAGVEPSEASGGMDLQKVESDFVEAAREYDRQFELLRAGPSDDWGTKTINDIMALLDNAEKKMLSLSAPDLPAVEKKLQTLWADDRYDPVEATTRQLAIMRDLRRLTEVEL